MSFLIYIVGVIAAAAVLFLEEKLFGNKDFSISRMKEKDFKYVLIALSWSGVAFVLLYDLIVANQSKLFKKAQEAYSVVENQASLLINRINKAIR